VDAHVGLRGLGRDHTDDERDAAGGGPSAGDGE
jgi:hypothetical protein